MTIKNLQELEEKLQQVETEVREAERWEEIAHILKQYRGEDEVISFRKYKEMLDEKKEDDNPLMTKIPGLDYITGGFSGGELVVVSGATGQGKTMIAQTFTRNFSEQEIKSLWFSYEVSGKDFLAKFGDDLPTGFLPKTLVSNKLVWIERKIVEAIAKYGVRAVFIDHLHYLINISQLKNSSLEIGGIVRELKIMAVKYNIVIFLIAHASKVKFEEKVGIEDIRDCLPGSQRVYVDGDYVLVKKLKVGDPVVSFGGMGKLQKDVITDVWKAGKKQIFQLTTKTGRKIECSDGHKFYALTHKKTERFGPNQGCGVAGWLPLRELKVGQKIAVVNKYPDTGSPTLTRAQSLLLGWIVGDGHINKRGYVEITANTEKDVALLKELGKDFLLNPKITKYPTKNAYRVLLSSDNAKNSLARWFRQRSFFYVGNQKRAPSEIFRESGENIAAFLSGLFHADGSVNKNGDGEFGKSFVVLFHSISEQLAREVQGLLLRFGILGFLRKQSLKDSGFRTKERFIWSVAIRGYDIIRFKELIGFQADKQKRFLELIKGWSSHVRKKDKSIYFDVIKKIELIGEEETYDLSVRGCRKSSKNNSFCVNDFITHNSSFIGQEASFVFIIWRGADKQSKMDIKENGVRYNNTSVLSVEKNRRTGKLGVVKLTAKDGLFYEMTQNYE